MVNAHPSFNEVIKSPVLFLAFGFGSGCITRAPGTYGSLAALPFAYWLVQAPIWLQLAVIIAAAAVGIWLCDQAAKRLQVHDHPGIVWDEFVGLWIALLAAPLSWGWLLLGFFLFRVFDIFKPWPISWVDKRVHGGFGIMLDDILAGLAALACMKLFAMWV